ncbi:tautomerase [Achromobacter mucicolens]|uniref:Tautomerase n=1 Tax=Achromobacter mucicolens TaxID=1389922 RepID=A0ABD4Z425_9BURK|nr:tautomerase [Achromobacter mucicolens]MDH1182121.1 tautomerase [Achromobacter mucicolens]
MPNIIIKIPTDVLDAGPQQRLVDGVVAAAAAAEQIPDNPKNRFLCWTIVEQVAAGHWAVGGQDVTSSYIPILMQVFVPAGVLNEAGRAIYAKRMHQAATAALSTEKRRILMSCIFQEVDDGTWAVDGTLWRLPDFSRYGGYAHLQHLVSRS